MRTSICWVFLPTESQTWAFQGWRGTAASVQQMNETSADRRSGRENAHEELIQRGARQAVEVLGVSGQTQPEQRPDPGCAGLGVRRVLQLSHHAGLNSLRQHG